MNKTLRKIIFLIEAIVNMFVMYAFLYVFVTNIEAFNSLGIWWFVTIMLTEMLNFILLTFINHRYTFIMATSIYITSGMICLVDNYTFETLMFCVVFVVLSLINVSLYLIDINNTRKESD